MTEDNDNVTAEEIEAVEKMDSYSSADVDAVTVDNINDALQHYLNLGIITEAGVPSVPHEKLVWAITLADGAQFVFAQKCDIIAFIDGMLAMTNAQDALAQKMFGGLLTGNHTGKKK